MYTPIWKYEMYTSSINKNTVQQAKNNPIQWPDFLDKYANFIPARHMIPSYIFAPNCAHWIHRG